MRTSRLLIRLALLAVASAIAAPASVAAADDADAFRGRRMPYEAFDRLPATRVNVGGAAIDIAFAPGDLALPRKDVVTSIVASARTVAAYYGRFPVEHARLLIVPGDGSGVRGGTAFGHRGAAVRITLGRDVTAAELATDWIVVHELTHFAFPSVGNAQHWIEEGLATYVESIARVQAGQLTTERIWREFARRMPQGLPAAGDQGLDHTPTWGRTYWGGAIFCLLADVQIRERTHNAFGLQHALRAIVAADGNITADWTLEQALAVGDAAVGVPVLEELYATMKATPAAVDLPLLWRRLGVVTTGDAVTFDDDAPLAAIRRAITAPAAAATAPARR